MSSELGLNMMRTAAGLKLEIDVLIQQQKSKLFLHTEAVNIERNDGIFRIALRDLLTPQSKEEMIEALQV